jgi:hypothetical protein
MFFCCRAQFCTAEQQINPKSTGRILPFPNRKRYRINLWRASADLSIFPVTRQAACSQPVSSALRQRTLFLVTSGNIPPACQKPCAFLFQKIDCFARTSSITAYPELPPIILEVDGQPFFNRFGREDASQNGRYLLLFSRGQRSHFYRGFWRPARVPPRPMNNRASLLSPNGPKITPLSQDKAIIS